MSGYLYLFPCVGEDHLKLGISTDPLARIRSFSPRWFEFFDLDEAALLEFDGKAEARAWETRLKRELRELNAPAPLQASSRAGGHTEWFRGSQAIVVARMQALAGLGVPLHRPARAWLRAALARASDDLYAWSEAMLQALREDAGNQALARTLRDACDAHQAMGLPLQECVPAAVLAWHRGEGD